VLLIIGKENRHEEFRRERGERNHSHLDKGVANPLLLRIGFVPASYEVIVTIRKAALLVFVVFVLFPLSGFATYSEGRDDSEEINMALGAQGWFSQANAKWQISFPYTTSAGVPGKIESRLDFGKIDSPLYIATAGGNIAPRFALDVVYGYGSITGGHGTDSDRFLPSAGGGLVFSQSKNTIDGDVRLWGIDFYYNTGRFAEKPASPWGFVLGYLHYRDSLRMTNGVQTVSVPFDGSVFPPVGPFPANEVLNSTYDFSWNLLKVGIIRQAKLAKDLSYSIALSAYPYVDYEGEGYWNLRAGANQSDFRVQSPNFIQKSKNGYGYEASLGLGYEFSENLELVAGYRYFFLYARGGTDTTFFADGSEYTSDLDWVTVTRRGAYAEMMFKF
jgi:opacity protein-like surface antigen